MDTISFTSFKYMEVVLNSQTLNIDGKTHTFDSKWLTWNIISSVLLRRVVYIMVEIKRFLPFYMFLTILRVIYIS